MTIPFKTKAKMRPWLSALFWLLVLGAMVIVGNDVLGRVQANVKKAASAT